METQKQAAQVQENLCIGGKKAWPELNGVKVEVAKETIERENPDVRVEIVPPGYSVTCDYRLNRVRVYTSGDYPRPGVVTFFRVEPGVVTTTPMVG